MRKLQLEIHTKCADFGFIMTTEASEVLGTLLFCIKYNYWSGLNIVRCEVSCIRC